MKKSAGRVGVLVAAWLVANALAYAAGFALADAASPLVADAASASVLASGGGAALPWSPAPAVAWSLLNPYVVTAAAVAKASGLGVVTVLYLLGLANTAVLVLAAHKLFSKLLKKREAYYAVASMMLFWGLAPRGALGYGLLHAGTFASSAGAALTLTLVCTYYLVMKERRKDLLALTFLSALTIVTHPPTGLLLVSLILLYPLLQPKTKYQFAYPAAAVAAVLMSLAWPLYSVKDVLVSSFAMNAAPALAQPASLAATTAALLGLGIAWVGVAGLKPLTEKKKLLLPAWFLLAALGALAFTIQNQPHSLNYVMLAAVPLHAGCGILLASWAGKKNTRKLATAILILALAAAALNTAVTFRQAGHPSLEFVARKTPSGAKVLVDSGAEAGPAAYRIPLDAGRRVERFSLLQFAGLGGRERAEFLDARGVSHVLVARGPSEHPLPYPTVHADDYYVLYEIPAARS